MVFQIVLYRISLVCLSFIILKEQNLFDVDVRAIIEQAESVILEPNLTYFNLLLSFLVSVF